MMTPSKDAGRTPGAKLEARIRELHHALVEEHGHRQWQPHGEPVLELVKTILSQNTSDVNRDRAFRRLRERFPTWEAVRDAGADEIADAIRPGGLAQIKAPRIKRILKSISADRGALELGFLSDMEMPEALEWLEGFKGVGPKTAACVLLFALGKPAMPVDTHVQRVTGLIGLIPSNASSEKAHRILQEATPPQLVYEFHILIIHHGREVCKASKPLCFDCALANLCEFPDKTPPPSDG